MRPEIREIVQKLVTYIEAAKGSLKEEEDKRRNDEFMFCFGNCYTMEETERHMANQIPSLTPELVITLFQTYIDMISDEESRQAYLREAEECAQARAEAKEDQGEVSITKAPTSD